MASQSFSKFVRPEEPSKGQISDRDLDILDAVLRYRFSPASQLVRLVGGNEDLTHRRLRHLWEKGLVNRWAFPGIRTHSEFYYYYLDSRETLNLLAERRISPLFTDLSPSAEDDTRTLPHYLQKPDIILDRIWALPDRCLHALGDGEN